MRIYPLKKEDFLANHVAITDHLEDGLEVLQVVKNDKLDEFDIASYAKLKGVSFRNATIQVKLKSRLLADAPDFARGFIGIAFRIKEDDSAFESFYLRPSNGRTEDPIRKNRACQYFSYPTYTFDYFRQAGISDYEGPVAIGLDEWIDLKAVIRDKKADFYVNGRLVLTVNDLKHGSGQAGAFGFFVDTGTKAYFKELAITIAD